MVVRQSSKTQVVADTQDPQLSNQAIATQLVTGFLSSANHKSTKTASVELPNMKSLQENAQMDAYYIANLFEETVSWLNKIAKSKNKL